jgi:hypothetical protein
MRASIQRRFRLWAGGAGPPRPNLGQRAAIIWRRRDSSCSGAGPFWASTTFLPWPGKGGAGPEAGRRRHGSARCALAASAESYSPLIAAPIRGAAQRERPHPQYAPRPSNLFSFLFLCILLVFCFLILFSLFLIYFLFYFFFSVIIFGTFKF